ncbi:hypothetical protein B0H17DRAFT_1202810 [Mycena rosella]|uniref:Cyanovirin-N domain-containing protein n=1 Tax=Mycena rosella TaxID=1033263 RepID=A0AAD7DG51_MYCRO|nr:hypothetical protein B0H17DRAFT_1202810 [Mycena rosella]
MAGVTKVLTTCTSLVDLSLSFSYREYGPGLLPVLSELPLQRLCIDAEHLFRSRALMTPVSIILPDFTHPVFQSSPAAITTSSPPLVLELPTPHLPLPAETMCSITTLLILSSASVFGAAVLGTKNTTISTRHDGGFGATCSGFALSGDSSSNYILRASCPNNDGTVIYSSLYLNSCVANE